MCKPLLGLVGIAIVGLASGPLAAEVTWNATTPGSDFADVANWTPSGPTASTDRSYLRESVAGVDHNPVLNSFFNAGERLLVDEDNIAAAWSITGTGTLKLGGTNNVGYILHNGDLDWTIDVGELQLSRSSNITCGDWITAAENAGTGNLIIGHSGGSMVFKVGLDGSSSASQAPSFNANNGTDIIVYPTVSFTKNTSSSGRSFSLKPSAGSTIALYGGISGATTTAARLVMVNGSAGGKVVLGDSSGLAGNIQVLNGDLEINHNFSLGSTAGYTEIKEGTNTGALLLTNNITTAEDIYIYGRTTTDNPHIRNVSGSNTLAFNVSDDRPNSSGYCMISSDGTAAGDLLTIQGDVVRTSAAGGGNGELWLMGVGKGVITGNVIQTGTNNSWTNVQKTGAGTWTLAGSNSYSGTTTIADGTLVMNGTYTGGGAFSVLAGGTLAGGGMIDSTVSLTGKLTPGSSAGTLTVGGLSLTGGTLAYELDALSQLAGGGVNDLTVVTGALDLSGGATLNVSVLNGTTLGQGMYELIQYGSLLAGDASSLALGIIPLAPGDLAFIQVDGNSVNLVVTPEPAMLGLLTLGGLAGLRRRRS